MSLLRVDGASAASGVYSASPPYPATNPGTRSDGVTIRGRLSAWSLADRLKASSRVLAALLSSKQMFGGRVAPQNLHGDASDEDAAIARTVAGELRLPFVASIDPDSLIVRERDLQPALTRPGGIDAAMIESGDGESILLVSPQGAASPGLRSRLLKNPLLATRLQVTTRRTLREAFVARAAPQLLRNARGGLFDRFPELSARVVLNSWQGAVLGAGLLALPAALILAPVATMFVLHGFFSLLFFACVFLRLAAVRHANPGRYAPLKPVNKEDLPIYTILVALRNEAEIVPDLLVALGRLQWPRDKLEIKLICESDDTATLQALEAQSLRSLVEIVKVPPAAPRTKPKALAFALQLAAGDFVALYDAEDRPHPQQLLEAWQRFRTADLQTACLQAPLVISNWNGGMLPRMFAFEYAALFRGLLPWLSRKQLMFPLGGTSNHFRKAALETVGGWDPYNVTEDADLGLRLHRFGFRSETITRPTFEDAPDDLAVWVRQRTRWFKGWLQTWLVHMRAPGLLAREMGPASFLTAQVLFAGMVASALVHPLLILALAGVTAKIAWVGAVDSFDAVLLVVDSLNLACGYLAFLILGRATLTTPERDGFWNVVLWTPAYWLLMSAAAWRSIWQLYRQPHLWEKTPHRPHHAVMAERRLWQISRFTSIRVAARWLGRVSSPGTTGGIASAE